MKYLSRKMLYHKIREYLEEEQCLEKSPSILDKFIKYHKLNDEDEGYFDDEEDISPVPNRKMDPCSSSPRPLNTPQTRLPEIAPDLNHFLERNISGTSFAQKLNSYMYERNITTTAIYRRCLVDRRLISKITASSKYHPSKTTVFALCIALRLNLTESEEFLNLAGYTFNRSSQFDLILRYFIMNRIYDLDTINDALEHFQEPCFGD